MPRVSFFLLLLCILNKPVWLFAETWSQVFQIVAENCGSEPSKRYQSGFLLEGYDGMLTALHGVVDCETFKGRNSITGKIFHGLQIVEVDIENDVALLASAELSHSGLKKLVRAQDVGDAGTHLLIVGHPQSLLAQHQLPVELESKEKLLEHLLPIGGVLGRNLIKRGSPAIGTPILSLNGNIQPGHSGAPILDHRDHVVGIGNGGLKMGTVGIGWGIPISELDLKSKDKRASFINLLKNDKPELLFDFAPEDRIKFTVAPATVQPGKDVTLYFDERPKDPFTVYMAGKALPKTTLLAGKEVRITVPGDLSSGRYYIRIKRWEDDPSKSKNQIFVKNPNPYDSFHFSVLPVFATAGEDVFLKMSSRIGFDFDIYIQKTRAAKKIQLYKKNSSNHETLVINLPENLTQGDWVFELRSRNGTYSYKSNSIFIKNPGSANRRAPPAPTFSADLPQLLVAAAVATDSGSPLNDPRVSEAIQLIVKNHNQERAKRLLMEAGWPNGFSFNVSKRRFTQDGGTLQDLKLFNRRLRVFRVSIIQAP